MNTVSRESFGSHPLLARLLTLHEVPEHIHIEGTLPEVTIDSYGRATPRILTIVGSRACTPYAEVTIKHLVASLRGAPVVILSGLAYGIDSLAHKEALSNNIKTVAVLGTSLDRSLMYPKEHLSLRDDIVEQGGAVLSELDPDTKAAPWTFPARNRIVAALSDAVLLVEAREKSGTLITARLALELGKDIGAIPGDIFSEQSKGTNALIRDGAACVTSADDLFELLHLSRETKNTDTPDDCTLEEVQILKHLSHPMQTDELLAKSELTSELFLQTLTRLEMRGYVEERFGEVRKVV